LDFTFSQSVQLLLLWLSKELKMIPDIGIQPIYSTDVLIIY